MRTLLAGLMLVAGVVSAQTIILPDTGWVDSVTAQPDTIGSPSDEGYTAQCMALWDVVQYREFSGTFDIGVAAFHMNGIDRVEFAVDGGTWVPVMEMTLNTRIDVWEYTIRLDAAYFEEGGLTVRAVAYPKGAGVARVLNDLVLNVDKGTLAHDTLWVDGTAGDDGTGDGSESNPYATHDRALTAAKSANGDWSGLVLMTQEGDYSTPGWNESWEQRWMHIEGAPGTDMHNVRFISRDGNRCNISKVCFRGVTMAPTSDDVLLYPARSGKSVWFDRCHWQGQGGTVNKWSINREAATYLTGVTVDSFMCGPYGTWFPLIRDVHVSNLTEDSFRPSSHCLLVNCSSRDVDPAGTESHPDVVQMYTSGGQFENTIIYNLEAVDNINSQGISPTTIKDMAVVNTSVWRVSGGVMVMHLEAPVNHYLLLHCTFNQSINYRIDTGRNIAVRNSYCSFGWSENATFNAQAICDNLHLVGETFNWLEADTDAPFTQGAGQYADPYDNDFTVTDTAVIRDRTDNGWVPGDINGNARAGSTAVGAYAYGGEYATAIDSRQLTVDKKQSGMAVWPNPMGQSTNIGSETPHRGVSTINIFDRNGKTIWISHENGIPRPEGRGTVSWDGTDQSGQTVPPGVYYISDGKNMTRVIKTR